MDWIRSNLKAAGALAALVALVLAVLVWIVTRPSGDSDGPSTLGLPSPTASSTPLGGLPTATASGGVDDKFNKALSQFGKGGGASAGSMNMPGLPGGGMYKHLPRHHVELRVFSEAPIGTVGYIVPTSLRNQSGIDKNVGKSWHLTTTAYGDPDYAQIFLQAGARGYPITCVITIDGKVTERRATEGPYGQTMCQG